MFIDVHCHLDKLEDPEKIISNSKKKNVGKIISAGLNKETNRKTLELANQFDIVKAALGIYPDEALKLSMKDIDSEIDFIKKNSGNVAAIAEVGMDFSGEKSDKDKKKQAEVFGNFVKLSIELKKPIVVHSRKAEIECIEILENLKAKRVVMHYFSGKLKLVERIVANGWMLSIPTAVKNSEHFQKVIEKANLDNLLCETDSPYSHPDKEFPNNPANVVESYKAIAKIKGLSLKEIEAKIEDNWNKLVK